MARIAYVALVLACIIACAFTAPLKQNSHVVESVVRSSHGHHSAPVHTANENHIASHDSTNNRSMYDDDENDEDDPEDDDDENDEDDREVDDGSDDGSDDGNGDESDDEEDNDDANDMKAASRTLSVSVRAGRCKMHCSLDYRGRNRCRKSCFPKWSW